MAPPHIWKTTSVVAALIAGAWGLSCTISPSQPSTHYTPHITHSWLDSELVNAGEALCTCQLSFNKGEVCTGEAEAAPGYYLPSYYPPPHLHTQQSRRPGQPLSRSRSRAACLPLLPARLLCRTITMVPASKPIIRLLFSAPQDFKLAI